MEQERYNSISTYLKQVFGGKTVKLAIDGGFTCPNRDGAKGFGGCTFCAGDRVGFASDIEDQIRLLSRKWPDAHYLAYFQRFTNTYAPVEVLRDTYRRALDHPAISGIAIATRPDCLGEDVLDLLEELNRQTFLWLELGLQTIHEETARQIRRGYTLPVFDQAMAALRQRNIRTVVHLILGLPGESQADMTASVRYACDAGAWGLKLHLLNIVEGSAMAQTHRDYLPFPSLDAYVQLVCDLLERIPPHIVMHRLTADAPWKDLISPPWSYKKRTILNEIRAELRRRDSCQGCRWTPNTDLLPAASGSTSDKSNA